MMETGRKPRVIRPRTVSPTIIVAMLAGSLAMILMYRAGTAPVALQGQTTVVFPTQIAAAVQPTIDVGSLMIQAAAFARQEVRGAVDESVATWTTQYVSTQEADDATREAKREDRLRAIAHSEYVNYGASTVTPTPSPTPTLPPCGTPDPGNSCDMMPTPGAPTAVVLPVCDVAITTPNSYQNMPGRFCTWATVPSERRP